MNKIYLYIALVFVLAPMQEQAVYEYVGQCDIKTQLLDPRNYKRVETESGISNIKQCLHYIRVKFPEEIYSFGSQYAGQPIVDSIGSRLQLDILLATDIINERRRPKELSGRILLH